MKKFLLIAACSIFTFASVNLIAAVAIPKIKLGKAELTEHGEMTEKSLPFVLAKLHRENKLSDNAFTSESCLNAKNIGSKGGYQTRQLFLVTSTCKPNETSRYIIKEPAGMHEVHALQNIQADERLKPFILPNKRKGFPHLALPIAYFSYKSSEGERTIEIMPRAKGESMSDQIIKFRDNQSEENRKKISRMFTNSCKQQSAFHRRFMEPEHEGSPAIRDTITHQDYHSNNSFYDFETDEVTWIDNESMEGSLHHPTSPWKDLVEPFALGFVSNFPQFTALNKRIDTKTWIKLSLHDCVVGYLTYYDQRERKKALKELRKMYTDYSVLGWAEFDPKTLENLKREVNLTFDQLTKELAKPAP